MSTHTLLFTWQWACHAYRTESHDDYSIYVVTAQIHSPSQSALLTGTLTLPILQSQIMYSMRCKSFKLKLNVRTYD